MKQTSKCILLVRVSTQKQDFDEQEKELYQLALNEGYSDNNIIPICEKESGIKLSEEERNGLNRMKEVIENENISCVFAWEISRIARKKKVIFSITDYLVARGIQLIIKEPYVRLLNPDKTINDGAETILTLFSQIAESEMRNKMARWSRTKKANSKAGIWNGGHPIRLGYKLGENNKFVIDEEEANFVRLIYELYTTTKMGQNHLRNELAKRGYTISQNQLQRVLKFHGYTGATVNSPMYINGEKKLGHDLNYPAIISEELYQKAQKKKEFANNECYKGHNYYFAKAIFRCHECGHLCIGYKHMGLYMCVARKHDNKDIAPCKSREGTININVLDTILWDATVDEYVIARAKMNSDSKEDYQKQIDICDEIISSTKAKIEKCNTKKKRIAITFANGDIDEEDYQKARDKVEQEISQINQDNVSAQDKKKQLIKMMNSSNQPSYVDVLKSISEDAYSYKDLQEMSEVVHTYISNVEVRNSDIKGYNTKYIKITTVSGKVYEYLSRYSCGGYREHRIWKKHKQLSSAFDEWIEINPELKINRVL